MNRNTIIYLTEINVLITSDPINVFKSRVNCTDCQKLNIILCTMHQCKLLVNSNTHLTTWKINLPRKSIRYSYSIKSCFQKLVIGHHPMMLLTFSISTVVILPNHHTNEINDGSIKVSAAMVGIIIGHRIVVLPSMICLTLAVKLIKTWPHGHPRRWRNTFLFHSC
jgi:hypothetical protein